MSDWLDNFQMMGVKLNEGEKSLMRFAMGKERERIIKLLEGLDCEKNADPLHDRHDCLAYFTADRLIALIKEKK